MNIIPNHRSIFLTIESKDKSTWETFISETAGDRITNEELSTVDSDTNPNVNEELVHNHSVPNEQILDNKIGSNGSMIIQLASIELLDV